MDKDDAVYWSQPVLSHGRALRFRSEYTMVWQAYVGAYVGVYVGLEIFRPVQVLLLL